MKILFLHGWTSVPGGVKPAYLIEHGHQVSNPALPSHDFAASLEIALRQFLADRPEVIVGSSRGGAVAMNLPSEEVPLVLLAPAWKHWGTAETVKAATTILHAPADEVIPFADSQQLLQQSGLEPGQLLAVGNDHRLAEPAALAAMLRAAVAAVTDHASQATGRRPP